MQTSLTETSSVGKSAPAAAFVPIALYVMTLATVLDAFTWDNINYLFVGAAGIGGIWLVARFLRNYPLLEPDGLLWILLYMLATAIWNYESTRWSSFLYSVFFMGTFLLYAPWVTRTISETQWRKVLMIIYWWYFLVLLLGQWQVYLGSFVPVSGINFFMRGTFGTILEKDGFRFFSLSSEPSYAAFIVIIIFYTYVQFRPAGRSLFQGSALAMFIALLYMLVSFRSAYGAGLLLVLLIDQSRTSLRTWIAISALGLLAILLLTWMDVHIGTLDRISNVLFKTDWTNPHSLYSVDFTAYYRVAPILHYLEMADFTNVEYLFGSGAGFSRHFVVPEIYGGYMGGEFLGGYLPAFFIDYGLVGGLLVLGFVFGRVRTIFSFEGAAIMLMLLNANFNTQLFWFMVLCLTTLKARRESQINAAPTVAGLSS